MHGLARLIAGAALASLGAGTGACKDAPMPQPLEPVQRPGAEGLVAFLEPRQMYADWTGGCAPTRAEHEAVVTPAYRAAHDIGSTELRDVLARTGAVRVRTLYADDGDVPASLRRSRPALPAGQPPLVASIGGEWLPALFVFRGRWLCLLGIEHAVAERLDDADCRAAYQRSASGRCFDFTGALAAAVLAEDRETRERLCALMVAHGCGSVPAEATPPTEPSPPQ